MTAAKRLMLATVISAAVAGAYFAGVRNSSTRETASPPANDVILAVPSAKPAEITVENPTAVLLGEVKMPVSLLAPPPPPARPDLIVPILAK